MSASNVTTVSDVGDGTVTTGVGNVGTGTSAGDVTAVSVVSTVGTDGCVNRRYPGDGDKCW